MDSPATLSSRDEMVRQKENDTTFPAPSKYPSSRRTQSFSSSSSSSSSSLGSISYFPEDSPLSPPTPLRFSGIPFSWEHFPGIPKNKLHTHKKKESNNLLPLPPPITKATTSVSNGHRSVDYGFRKKQLYSVSQSFRKDPFFAAFLECSKDGGDIDDDRESNGGGYWTGAKVSRSISDRFGFVNLYGSCKKTCPVSEAIVYLPRPRRASYGRISHRSS